MQLDAHQHFWSYDPAQYPWIPPGSALHRDWLPHDLAMQQAPLGVRGSIAVQARQTLEETRWLLRLADENSAIRGVVGWVDLRSPSVGEQLAEFSSHPRFVGVRHVVQDEPDDAFLTGETFQRGLAALRAHRLCYDLLVYPRQLPAARRLVALFPEQPFVLDHLGKPPIKVGTFSPWRGHIQALAQAPNVFCKVSGLITEADHQAWTPEDLRPYLDVIFAAFGPDRLMWGSDWPVCLLAGSYGQVYRVIDDYAQALSPAQRTGLFGHNAARFYGIAEQPLNLS